MRKKVIFSVLGVAAAALAFTFSGNSQTEDTAGLFLDTDQIALAEGSDSNSNCAYGSYCDDNRRNSCDGDSSLARYCKKAS